MLIQGNATEFGSHLYWHEAQLHFAPERCGCPAEAGDGERWVGWIEDSIQCGAAGLHAFGQLLFGDVFLADGFLKLDGYCFLEGENFGFGQQSFAREELVEVAASVWIGRDHWNECIIFDAFVNRRFAGFLPAEAGTP